MPNEHGNACQQDYFQFFSKMKAALERFGEDQSLIEIVHATRKRIETHGMCIPIVTLSDIFRKKTVSVQFADVAVYGFRLGICGQTVCQRMYDTPSSAQCLPDLAFNIIYRREATPCILPAQLHYFQNPELKVIYKEGFPNETDWHCQCQGCNRVFEGPLSACR